MFRHLWKSQCAFNQFQLRDQILIGYGKDEQVMAGYFFGIKCSVGSTYNYAGKVFNKAIAELRAGNMDETNRLQRQMCHFLRRLFAHGFNDAMNKVTLSIDC